VVIIAFATVFAVGTAKPLHYKYHFESRELVESASARRDYRFSTEQAKLVQNQFCYILDNDRLSTTVSKRAITKNGISGSTNCKEE
jgi:hypothetical protein